MLEVHEPTLPPESEALLRAVAEAIQKLNRPLGSEDAAEQPRLYARHLIDCRLRLKDPNVGAFEKLWRPLDSKRVEELTEGGAAPTDARLFEKRREVANKNTTRNEIANFRRAAERLLSATLALHAPARRALGLTDTPPVAPARRALGLTDTPPVLPGFALEDKLKELIERSEHPVVPDLPQNAGRGRKQRSSEAAFTSELARVFQLYTGNKPTRRNKETQAYGPFYEFVRDIFGVLQVSASPGAQGRATLEAMAKYADENQD